MSGSRRGIKKIIMLIFREGEEIMLDKKDWTTQQSKEFFIDMLEAFEAVNALCLSHMPERIMKFLSWFGLNCDRDKALEVMYLMIEHGTSFLSTSASIALCLYECVIVPVFGARHPDTDRILIMTNKELDVCEQVSNM